MTLPDRMSVTALSVAVFNILVALLVPIGLGNLPPFMFFPLWLGTAAFVGGYVFVLTGRR